MSKRQLLALGVFVLASWQARATTCDSALSMYEYYVSTPGMEQYAQDVLSNHPECFGATPQQSTTTITQTSFVQIASISIALANRFLAAPPIQTGQVGLKGKAASVGGKAWNAWGNLTSNTTDQEYRSVTGNTVRNDADALTTTVGVDYSLSPQMVVGLSAAFDRATGQGTNSGSPGDVNRRLLKGYAVAPYLGYAINKQLALDASLGFGAGKLSQTGNVSAEADRWFAGVNLNYSNWLGNTQVSGRLGWYHGEEDYDDAKQNGSAFIGTAAKNRIDQWRLGVQAGWWMNGAMPYVGLSYLAERRSSTLAGATDPIGKDAWQLSLGASFLSLASGVTGGIAYEQEFGRSNQDNYRLIANIGIRF